MFYCSGLLNLIKYQASYTLQKSTTNYCHHYQFDYHLSIFSLYYGASSAPSTCNNKSTHKIFNCSIYAPQRSHVPGKQKPALLLYHNKMAVNMLDSTCRQMLTKATGKGWHLAVFFNVLNLATASINVRIPFQKVTSSAMSRRQLT